MRVALLLAVLLPFAVVVAWFLTRPIIARRQRLRHLAELEAENQRLDRLLDRSGELRGFAHPSVRGGVRERER